MTGLAPLTLASHYFGTLECDPCTVFHFPRGIPGFESERHFAPIEIPAQRPIVYLQSLDRPDLCLVTLPVQTVCSTYDLQLAPEDATLLGCPAHHTGEDFLTLAILHMDERRAATANLLAPLVINRHTRQAVQAIQFDSVWTCDHPLPDLAPC